jgi:hypothetical protein
MNTTVVVHPISPCGTNANMYGTDSVSSLETRLSTGDREPAARLNSGWNTAVRLRTISVDTSDSLLPSHVRPVSDWIADLQMVFSSSSPSSHHYEAASSSNGVLNFEEFKSLFEPRPIELMIKK